MFPDSSFLISRLIQVQILSVAIVWTAMADEPDEEPEEPKFQVSADVESALSPLFSSILKADLSRATVELTVETVMNGLVVETEKATYQIASKYPDRYTVYYNASDMRRRIYCDGEQSVVALSPNEFVRLPDVRDTQQLVDQLPLSIGPYPEPVLALSLAGVDPAMTFLSGMKSVEIVQRTKFRGITDSIRLRGQQDDLVIWDLWMSDEEKPRPLRLLVDLTPMLLATDQVAVPEGYGYSLRYDFKSWRVSGELDENLFSYNPPEDAKEFASVAEYEKSLAGELGEHPMLGKPAPEFELTLDDGTKVSSDDLKGKIIVLDFWATWCKPCLKALPTISAACQKYPKDVVVYAVNVGEQPALVRGYVSEQDWGMPIAVDPKGELAELFSAKKIPLTLVISRDGNIEAAHVGFAGTEALSKQFEDEFEVLLQDGRIATPPPPAE